jgi:transposase, IS5 family
MSTRWAGHRRRKPVHGYKAHIATDEEGDIIRCVEVTTANVHDGTVLEAVLPVEPGDVYADSADAARRFTDVILDRGGRPHMVQTGTWGGEAALQRLQAWNAAVRRVRCRIEKVFGTWKRSYGLRRMRWLGLAKASLQVRLTAVAYNLRRSVTILRARESTGGVMTGGVCPQSQHETSGTASEW